MMKRRGFLLGLSAALAAPAVVRASSLMRIAPIYPRLYGDGLRDDTEALQAYLDGEPVIFGAVKLKAQRDVIDFPVGSYLISSTLEAGKPGAYELRFGRGDTTLYWPGGTGPAVDAGALSNVRFDGHVVIDTRFDRRVPGVEVEQFRGDGRYEFGGEAAHSRGEPT